MRILGQVDLDELLVNRDEINQRPQQIIDQVTDPYVFGVWLRDKDSSVTAGDSACAVHGRRAEVPTVGGDVADPLADASGSGCAAVMPAIRKCGESKGPLT
ncbi:hypothetical protein ACIRL2_40595 [Embleya sp. NPDC127516]|uniref:hypothetical protein n=1 Tax=Embleya sp. NPDC127516 TaxID=3363990 RepID=UPI0038176A6C